MAKVLRKSVGNHKAQFPKLKVFIGQTCIFRHYCIENVKNRIKIRVQKINNESLALFSQFISVKVKTILRESQA